VLVLSILLARSAMSWQEVAAEHQASVVQAAQGDFIVIRDASEVERKRSKVVAEGAHQAQAIVDFDYTLTRCAAVQSIHNRRCSRMCCCVLYNHMLQICLILRAVLTS
jgi:hypothetical protein